MEALSRGIGKLWYCRECVDCVAVSIQLRFWCTQVIKPEEAWKPRLCILFASNPACCQDYAVCHFLRLLQSFQSLVISSCSWSVWTVYCLADSQGDEDLDQQRHSAGSSERCVLHG